MSAYDKAFYDDQAGGSAHSAAQIAPYICKYLRPATVLDVGCGVGAWAAAFAAAGVEAYGMDGPWVDVGRFALGPERFIPFDFSTATMPFDPPLTRPRFDLIITLEFLEHVDRDRAEALVKFLTDHSDMIVCGAALPGQGGTHHVNEQWPDYWRGLFAAQGFQAYDFLRPAVWDWDVRPWYAQNTIGYLKGGPPAGLVAVTEALVRQRLEHPPSLVHPGVFATAQTRPSLRKRVKRLLRSALGR
jgi:SAM-dependent methyltransferase